MTGSQLHAGNGGRIDKSKVERTTQDDIRRHMIEDGEDPGLSHDDWYPSPASVRQKLGLSQAQLADELRLPLGTWRNWEQGRVELDPVVRALLLVLWRIPQTAMRTLHGCPTCFHEGATREPAATSGEIVECPRCGSLYESKQGNLTSVRRAQSSDRRRA